MLKIYKSTIITPKKDKKIEFFDPGYMVVDENGKILDMSSNDLTQKYKNAEVIEYKDCIIIPGLIDTHNHLPQYAFTGLGDLELLPWLETYTFPREKDFENEKVSRKSSDIFFKNLIENGTTTTVTYVTIHKNATDIAFESARKSKIRVLIGKVEMDQNSPKDLKKDIDTLLRETEELIEKWHNKDDKLDYVITPRFAISCSFELMKKLAKLRDKYDIYAQSHLAENREEIEKVKKLFPKSKNYTDVYKQAGFLSPKTIMAHCIYLSDDELEILEKTNTKIAHCPTSNSFLSSGIMPYIKYKNRLSIGLGSDVAGGYTLSMFEVARHAIEMSKIYKVMNNDTKKHMSTEEAFFLATLYGAEALSMEDKIGSLEENKKADFIVMDMKKIDPFNNLYNEPHEILSKIIYRGNKSSIKNIYINGERLL